MPEPLARESRPPADVRARRRGETSAEARERRATRHHPWAAVDGADEAPRVRTAERAAAAAVEDRGFLAAHT